MVVVLAIIVFADVGVVVVVVSDSARSLLPEVLRISRRLGGCDLYPDLATSLLMCRQASVYVYIVCPLVVDPAVWDRPSPVS